MLIKDTALNLLSLTKQQANGFNYGTHWFKNN